MESARLLSLMTLLFLFSLSNVVSAQDELNCLMCHKYRGLSSVDENGNFRLFYINEELFESSPHSRNQCTHCHSDIDRIPHEKAQEVNCTQECHILEPSGNKKFSHALMAEYLSRSAHGRFETNEALKPYQEDYPGCKDCHDMPLYRPLSFYKEEHSGISKRGLSRCKSCHEKGDFAEDFYSHVTTRLHKTRSPAEMIRICAKCHQDPFLLQRHDMDDSVTSYKETFHYKLIALGSEKMPDCVDCHVVAGENVHLIESRQLPTSSVAQHNVLNTCRSAECHTSAGANLAGFQTHVTYAMDKYPIQFFLLLFFKSLLAGVMYFFLTFIFLELLRRLFPDFSFNREERMLARERKKSLSTM